MDTPSSVVLGRDSHLASFTVSISGSLGVSPMDRSEERRSRSRFLTRARSNTLGLDFQETIKTRVHLVFVV